jgi:prepilin-type N-terminal cleavage/methylation domain-containing protein
VATNLTRRRQAGFTLIEMMMAILLTMLVFLVIATYWPALSLVLPV